MKVECQIKTTDKYVYFIRPRKVYKVLLASSILYDIRMRGASPTKCMIYNVSTRWQILDVEIVWPNRIHLGSYIGVGYRSLGYQSMTHKEFIEEIL